MASSGESYEAQCGRVRQRYWTWMGVAWSWLGVAWMEVAWRLGGVCRV